ncbi:MAG: AsmA family protein [Candidatus Acidiferrales bacterium]
MRTALREQSIHTEKYRKPHGWMRRGTVTVLLLVVLVWAGDAAISVLVQHSRLRAKITARLEAAFGRPVEVGSYGFSIWGGPVLEADSVRIGEDPRFGNEYFIRADSIAVSLGWRSLLRGHLSIGTLSVSGASLNLVRDAEGEWNLAEWLPRPATRGFYNSSPAGPLAALSPALQFHRIDISDSRIDFKRGYEKLAFALVNVNGSMETDSPGRWRIDMTASPWRAAVITQQPGVINMTGHIGGTSSRLRPAALEISWTDASISDLFRLARGDDYGIRGDVAVFLSAHTEPSEPVNGWVINGSAKISGLHRWDMAARPDNPTLNLVVKQALLDPSLSEVRVPDLLIEAPHSNAHANAAFNWTAVSQAGKAAIAASDSIDLTSSQIDLRDALDWVRAFHPGVPGSTSIRGIVDLRAHFAGWPVNLTSASVRGERAELIASGLDGPVRVGPIDLRYQRDAIFLKPATLAWGRADDRRAGSFHIDASARGRTALFPSWNIAGTTGDAHGVAVLGAALGVDLRRGWDVEGPLSCDLRWQGILFPWDGRPSGVVSLGASGAKSGGGALRTPFLNLPVDRIHARVEMKPDASEITVTSAKAFGTNWSGTFTRRTADAEWQFALSTDQLSAADLDRWLNPRWRESFLDRMLPFLGTPADRASPENLRANGSLSIGEFALEPLTFGHLSGNLQIDGRSITLSDAKGQFYGGQVTGFLHANLSAVPSYHGDFSLARADGGAFAAETPALAGLRAGTLDGQISIDAKGASRSDLIASITCRASAHAGGIGLRGLDFQRALGAPSQSAPSPRSGDDARITSASAAFTCAHRAIQFQRLSLDLQDTQSLIGAGSIGFDRSIDLRLHEVRAGSNGRAATVRLTGTLSSPQISREPVIPPGR